jgi:hypothetical protein
VLPGGDKLFGCLPDLTPRGQEAMLVLRQITRALDITEKA